MISCMQLYQFLHPRLYTAVPTQELTVQEPKTQSRRASLPVIKQESHTIVVNRKARLGLLLCSLDTTLHQALQPQTPHQNKWSITLQGSLVGIRLLMAHFQHIEGFWKTLDHAQRRHLLGAARMNSVNPMQILRGHRILIINKMMGRLCEPFFQQPSVPTALVTFAKKQSNNTEVVEWGDTVLERLRPYCDDALRFTTVQETWRRLLHKSDPVMTCI